MQRTIVVSWPETPQWFIDTVNLEAINKGFRTTKAYCRLFEKDVERLCNNPALNAMAVAQRANAPLPVLFVVGDGSVAWALERVGTDSVPSDCRVGTWRKYLADICHSEGPIRIKGQDGVGRYYYRDYIYVPSETLTVEHVAVVEKSLLSS